MLLELRVRNLALIEKADVEFHSGLNVLTGETGAGKSILIDSINMALGAKASKDRIRYGADYGYVELIFSVEDEKKCEKLKEMGLEMGPDRQLIITRKIYPQRNVIRINDETCTLQKLRNITAILIDIHGQHEHQSLMSATNHLEILDVYAGQKALQCKQKIAKYYREYKAVCERLSESMDEHMRVREKEILEYEIQEISQANIRPGEEDELATKFQRLKNANRIQDALAQALQAISQDYISEAEKKVNLVSVYDEQIADIEQQLRDISNLIDESMRSMEDYIAQAEYDEGEFLQVQERLDFIRHIQSKYGIDTDEIGDLLEKKEIRLAYLNDYDLEKERELEEKERLEQELEALSNQMHDYRIDTAKKLIVSITEELRDLNFLGVQFDIQVTRLKNYTLTGNDTIEFLISTNPGQPLKPLKDVASGGELSRMMLALKTVLASVDEVDTLIFDEIDSGISGRTAQKVSEKLVRIGKQRQVICISHLPQIAAMADYHYHIVKETDGVSTKTEITEVLGDEIVAELARLLGGSEITQAVLDTAGEMKKLADKKKIELI